MRQMSFLCDALRAGKCSTSMKNSFTVCADKKIRERENAMDA